MKTLTGKLNFFSAAICLLTALFAVVAISSIPKVSESGSSSEIVEVDFEEFESVAQRERRRASDLLRPALNRRPDKLLSFSDRFQAQDRFFPVSTERDRLNGFGGFLRI